MLQIRFAQNNDNLQLQSLSEAVPFETQTMSYKMVRQPDYFSFSKIQGVDHRILVAEEQGEILGTMTVIVDRVRIFKKVQKVAYTADLKLLPKARGKGVADRLMQEAIKVARETFESPLPVYTCVMKDNPVGLKKNQNLARDGHAKMQNIAEIKAYFVLPFETRSHKAKRYVVRAFHPSEHPILLHFWKSHARYKQLSREYTALGLEKLMTQEGLRFFGAYSPSGELVGTLGIWDQRHIRQVVLLKENAFQAGVQKTWNRLHPYLGWPAFPQPGQTIPIFHALHPCISLAHPSALQALLLKSFEWIKQTGGLLLGLALDSQDPLNLQMKPFFTSCSELWLLSDDERFHGGSKSYFQFEVALG